MMETNTQSFEMKQPTLLSHGLSALEAQTVQSLLPGLSEVVAGLSDVHSTEKQVLCSPTENSPGLSASKSRSAGHPPENTPNRDSSGHVLKNELQIVRGLGADCPQSKNQQH
jgi:hypothetical protein